MWFNKSMTGNKVIKLNAIEENFPQASAFVEDILDKRHINARVASETKSLFEALFRQVVSQCDNADTELKIGSVRKLGHIDLKITFSGKRFSLLGDTGLSESDAKIIETFSHKISCSYQGSCNVVRISVNQSAWTFILPNLIGVIAAIIVGVTLQSTLDVAAIQWIANEWVLPLEKLFTNAVLMVGAPMTLFSLLKNVTDVFMVAERHSSSRRLFISSLSSSFIVVVVAIIMGFAVAQSILSAGGVTERVDIGFESWSLASAVDQIIPSSIIEPFEPSPLSP